MKMFKSYLLPLLALVLLGTACQTDNAEKTSALRYIPDDINSLLIIDMPDLMQKADFEEIKELDFYKKFLLSAANEKPSIARILEDPAASGLNIDEHFYLAMKMKSTSGAPDFAAFVAPVQDKDALEQTLSALDIQFVPASQNFGYSDLQRGHMVWNDEVIVMGVGSEEGLLHDKIESFLNTTPKNGLYRNKNLQKSLKRDFDMAHWLRLDPFLEGLNNELFSAVAGLSQDDLTDNYLNSFVHFNAGEMEGETFFQIKRGVTNDLQLFFKEKVKTNFGKHMPGEGLGVMMTAAMDLKGINQILIEKHVKGLGIQRLEEYRLSFEDFVRAFSGEVAIGAYSRGSGEAFPLVVLPVEKEKRFNTLLDFALDKGIISAEGKGRYILQDDNGRRGFSNSPGYLLYKNDMLYLSDQSEILDEIASGNFKRGGTTIERMSELMANNIFSLFGDIEWLSQVDDDFADLPFADFESKTNRNKASFILRMNDHRMNSLKQFFIEMNKIYLREGGDKI